jgi:hypothetical protein
MRFTIRRMMLAIAVFTIALYVGLSYRRSAGYWRQARFWAHAKEVALVRARNVESGFARLDNAALEEKRRALGQATQFAAYSSRLESKYEQAAFLPWLPVERDPAPP